MFTEGLPAGTKRRLLDLLLRGERTAEELAAQLDVSPTAVRQHLATLTALGLVERRTADPTAGRPAYLYRLGEAGRLAYPKRHDLLLRELIEALVAREGREGALAVVTDAARRVAEEASAGIADPDPEERWEKLVAWLEDEFVWEADVEETSGGGTRLVLHQCPFRAVSAEHPAVCGTFFAALLERLARRGPFHHRVIADGVCCCSLEGGPLLPEEPNDAIA